MLQNRECIRVKIKQNQKNKIKKLKTGANGKYWGPQQSGRQAGRQTSNQVKKQVLSTISCIGNFVCNELKLSSSYFFIFFEHSTNFIESNESGNKMLAMQKFLFSCWITEGRKEATEHVKLGQGTQIEVIAKYTIIQGKLILLNFGSKNIKRN